MADARIDPFDVGALERSVNDSAGRVSGIWLSFVAFTAYLAAAASMISHRQIFLEEPIKLPTINIDLPLVASAVLLPLLFVIYHIFVLLQVVLLARTADAYNDAIEHNVTDEEDRIRVRQRLSNTLFAQLFAGSPREREGILGVLLRLMAWITLAIAPVGVLLIFEIKFLPYHSAAVTWTHRGLIVFDLLAVLMLWAGAVQPRRDMTWRSLMRPRSLTICAVVIFVLSNVLLTFPGEPGRMWMRLVAPSDQSATDMPECRTVSLVGTIVGPGFDRLVLSGEDFVDDSKLDKIIQTVKTNEQNPYDSERTRTFRGRDLRCARLAGTDLRHVDFGESDLSGAVLRGAHLEGATFAGASLHGAILDNAQLQDSSFAARAVVEKQLAEAQLPNSSFRSAQLQRANLENVNLRGASFRFAQLRDAKLDGAKLQGALFQTAMMQGASFARAQLQGASLKNVRMTGASFKNAVMHGASFSGAQLHGVTFYRSQLQGAHFSDTVFAGTSFVEAQMQGLQIDGKRGLQSALVRDSYLWHAGKVRCELAHVATPNFEKVIEVQYVEDRLEPIPANDREIADFIERSLQDVPETSRFNREFSKAKLRGDLMQRLQAAPSDASAPVDPSWQDCARAAAARKSNDFARLAANIAFGVCRSPSDPNPFVKSFLEGWNIGDPTEFPVATLFAKTLTGDTSQCPRATSLNEETKKLLQEVANPTGE